MDYLSIANAPVFWGLCGITVLISLGQALLFMRQANKTSAEVNLPQELPKKAFKIGMISAIGPACGVFIVMVGLMASIGGPMAWLRLSIIGAAATELSAATMGAQAAGVEFGGEGYTLTIMAVSWFAMALNGAGWLVVSGTITLLWKSCGQAQRRRHQMAGRIVWCMFPGYFWIFECQRDRQWPGQYHWPVWQVH